MATEITVPYEIVAPDGIREEMTDRGFTATVKFKCAWGDRYQLANDLLGTTVVAGSAILRVPPLAYPPSPNLFARPPLSIAGLGKQRTNAAGWNASVWVEYPETIVTCGFGVPDFDYDSSDPSGQPWTTTSLNVSGEFLTVPETTYRFADGTPTGTPVGKIIPQVEFCLKRHWMPYLPVPEMLALLGKVNNAPFTIAGFTCPTGTLLFLAGPSERQADTVGNMAQEVEYRAIYRPVPWNYYFHPNRTTGFAIVTDGNGNPPYEAGDFTSLP